MKSCVLKIPKLFKRKIIMFAHNGAQFDSYFALQIPGVEVSKAIDKGGLMSITIESELFVNTYFVLRDTRKFINGSLDQLCKSFKVPEQYCKSSMHHESITEDNWNDPENVAIW